LISTFFFSPSRVLAEAIAKDPSLSYPEGHPNKDWILGSQFDSIARALPILNKLSKDIPPVNAKIDNSNVSPIVDILTWHYLQVKIINLIEVKHLVLLCKYSINFTSVRKLNRSRCANEGSEEHNPTYLISNPYWIRHHI
jgi:hypothetical protein